MRRDKMLIDIFFIVSIFNALLMYLSLGSQIEWKGQIVQTFYRKKKKQPSIKIHLIYLMTNITTLDLQLMQPSKQILELHCYRYEIVFHRCLK